MKRAIKVKGKIRMMTFEEVYEQFKPLLYARTRNYMQHTLYEDIFQSALIGLWEAYRRYRKTEYEFITFATHYIRGNMSLFLRDYYKSYRKKTESDWDIISLHQPYDTRKSKDTYVADMIASGYELEEEVTSNLSVKEILAKMPERHQRIMILASEGYNQTEIARRMGTSRQAVNQQIRRIRSQFRKESKHEAMH